MQRDLLAVGNALKCRCRFRGDYAYQAKNNIISGSSILMQKPFIRPIAICLFRNGGRILVSEHFDTVKNDRFCRPLGGGIEFGETSADAMLREVKEELDLEIENLQLVGILENIFPFEGETWHEIVFVYDAEFVDKAHYASDEIEGYEHEVDVRFKAKWLNLSEVHNHPARLVPEQLLELLAT
jgi:8-oxo-dGTP pyrophosphatase MutT (NUDIX family)